jgi:GrxC family glutaredoxin
MSAIPVIRIYTTPWCGYCTAARELLDEKGVQYEVVDVGSDNILRRKMIELSGRQTVPQIFIDSQPVGGYDDIAALNASGKLDLMLGLNQPKSLGDNGHQ